VISRIEHAVVVAGTIVLGLSALLCLVRVLRGPTIFDRVLAFDCAVLELLGIVLLVSLGQDVSAYIDVILVVGLLGFLGTISLAAYVEGSLVD
jgi:multisubunit Na+/H+ antiporter MnhF subunit